VKPILWLTSPKIRLIKVKRAPYNYISILYLSGYKMKKSKKYRFIKVLMWLSQLLLTGFVVYWLTGQYKSERESLYKELHYEFLQAQDQAIDSSLHVLLQPLLNDSIGLKDSIPHAAWVSTDAVFDSIHVSSKYSPDGPVSDKIIQFDIRGEDHPRISQSATYEISTLPNNDAVLRGVKMIIQMSGDSTGEGNFNSFSSLPEVDSIVLLNLASDRLKHLNHSEFNIMV